MTGLTLYGISDELSALLNAIEEQEGYITPEQEKALEITQGRFTEKAVDYGHAILNLEDLALMAKKEKERLANIQEFYENTAKRLRDAISAAMQTFDQPKVETGTLRLSLRHTTATMIDDAEQIPDRFKTVKVEKVVNKTEIKKAIQAGEAVAGAHLQENVSLQIK